MQPNQTIRVVSVGAGATVRVWDKPTSLPIRQMSIYVSSNGAVLPAGGLTWNVYYGGYWTVGQPFVEGSTLAGGISQANGAFGAVEAANIIYDTGNLLPANKRVDPLPWGPAISVGLANGGASAMSVTVFFISRALTGNN